MVGKTERAESDRKLRMTQSPRVCVICLGGLDKTAQVKMLVSSDEATITVPLFCVLFLIHSHLTNKTNRDAHSLLWFISQLWQILLQHYISSEYSETLKGSC